MTKEEKEKKDEEIADSILTWIEKNNVYSYYDCQTYAYENDLHEWVEFFRSKKNARFIGIYLRSRKHHFKARYNDSMYDAVNRMVSAEEEYKKRNNIGQE